MTDDRIRIRAVVAYDGSGFHGFAEQPGVATVAGRLREVFERMFGSVADFTCAGRTDSGVHGWGQVVHADVERERFERVEPNRALVSMNKQLASRIVVREFGRAAPGFDARFSAVGRRYRYSILNTILADPFRAATTWWVREPLDIEAMNRAAHFIVGEHDFSTFCRHPKTDEPVSLVRRIHSAEWNRDVDFALLDIEANAFCHQMVRALTGMFVEIGRGRRPVEAMERALLARDRTAGAPLAPPQGLCLREVLYDEAESGVPSPKEAES